MTGPKVIQIGFNKCGTRSMYRFFAKNKLSGVHWAQGVVARDMLINLTTGKAPFHGHEEHVFYSDLMGPLGVPVIEGQFYYREMYEAYPDALFILNTREEDSWIRSRMRHLDLVGRFKKHYRLGSNPDVEALWREQWRAHHAGVTAFFADKPSQFCLFDIEKHDGGTLSAFVEPHYKTDPAKWGHEGKAEEQAA